MTLGLDSMERPEKRIEGRREGRRREEPAVTQQGRIRISQPRER